MQKAHSKVLTLFFAISFAMVVCCLAFPKSAFAAEAGEDPSLMDDEQYYEAAYVSCLTRNAGARLPRAYIECLCDKLADYATAWRKTHLPSEPLPAPPKQILNRCR